MNLYSEYVRQESEGAAMRSHRDYPQSGDAWKQAIDAALGFTASEGAHALRMELFPFDRVETWIREEFTDGFVTDFVPALLRNVQGLVSWVYGDGQEPFWPGSDQEESQAT